MDLTVVSIERFNQSAFRNQFAYTLLHPALTALREDGLEVAFEEGAGVLEVLFGVGFGGGDALKRLVEEADDSLLFGERRDGDDEVSKSRIAQVHHRRASRSLFKFLPIIIRTNEV